MTIDTVYLKDTLAELLSIASPTGYTDTIVRAAVGELRRLEVEMEITRRGAIRARLPGKSPRGARAMIAHLDTIGAQVKLLKENGRLEIVPVGTWSSRFAEGARATVFTDKGAYRGTILPLKASGHVYNEEIDTQPVSWSNVELRVDALVKGHEDLARLGFAIGDLVAIDPQSEFMDNDFIVSRHLDDKAGVATLFATIEALKREKVELPVDLFFIFSIFEEVGIGGASVLTDDVASLVAIDNGTTAPGQASAEFGVTIAMADQSGPFDYHLTHKLVKLCEENEIRYQKDLFRYYRSDSAAALQAGYDVRSALVTFGVDASHGYERVHLHALRSIAELLTAYAVSPVEIVRDREAIGSIAGFPTQPMEDADVFPRPGKPQL
ncbi:osmoprotectant NAGGN system M42 family peptidase [Acuticoccus sp. 2012]|uniref:Osmoprotectant NAGGN system M42 family peptidase n=1 Tax=Acuticoccus mangrovi TaxID=2796142 RepID=A0A934MGC9_9HYPH|nr:osmoprotectant NAGGN system M42 family peptidase [Acuticoccus mangrovi]MBJ3774836.1 osmoprotectant NAGGN system M42 family peptidase [Acuticoccus mangrovi]